MNFLRRSLAGCAMAACALAISPATAQLTEGDVAPNFTYNDINGNSHTLYDYLDQGYSVFITMSATWCGPCWSFHNSGTKASLWANHGPAGQPGVNPNTTDDLMVIFIEGDPSTSTNQLNGIGGGTLGNWVAGMNYPIIDLPNSQLVSTYGLTGFPNAWLICPNRIIRRHYGGYNSGIMNPQAIYGLTSGCQQAIGEVNPALFGFAGNPVLGCSAGDVDVIVTLQNMGTQPLTAATIEVSIDDAVVLSYEWTGNLNTYGTVDVNVGTLFIEETTMLNIAITSADEFPDDNTLQQEILAAPEIGFDIEVRFYTDNFPYESSWQIRNGNNAVVASGGPYTGPLSGGGPDALTTKVHQVTLPVATTCYRIRVLDTYGDGLSEGTNPIGQFGLEVFQDGVSKVNLNLGNFGFVHQRNEAMFSVNVLSTGEVSILSGMNIFPNPTNGMLNFEFNLQSSQHTQIDIFDIAGKRVIAKSLGNLGEGYHLTSVDTGHLNAGVYIANVTTPAGTSAHKVFVTK